MILIGVIALSGETGQSGHGFTVVVGSSNLHHICIYCSDPAVSVIAYAGGLSIKAVNAYILVIGTRAKASGIGNSKANFRNLLSFNGPAIIVCL